MPHAILEGVVALEEVVRNLDGTAKKWGPAVLKTEGAWLRSDGLAVLVEGVVVEHSRPLHPVAVITRTGDDTSVRLWRLAPVERTPAVQRWLASIADEVTRFGAHSVKSTNIAAELWQGLDLESAKA
jgi:hypothetical protein